MIYHNVPFKRNYRPGFGSAIKNLPTTDKDIDTVGANTGMIRNYLKHREKHEVDDKQLSLHKV